jgi:hypothetical protein
MQDDHPHFRSKSTKVNPVKTGDAKPWVFSRTFRAMTARPPKRIDFFNGLE